MSTASKLGAAFGVGLLGFMLLGSPAMAGPEGERKNNGSEATETDAAPGAADRDVESGGSWNADEHRYQGRSESNPDEEGVDKPYEAAGQAAESQTDEPEGDDGDFDGNNGCGNDSDFSDDNNGNCGRPDNDNDNDTDVKHDTDDNGDDLTTNGQAKASGAEVMGIQIERAAPAVTAAAAAPAAQVLAAQATAPAALARTGLPVVWLVAIGFALIGGGTLLRWRGRQA